MTNPLRELNKLGQSVWYDNLNRELLANGRLRKMVEEDGVSGGTSNPSIFEKAIASGDVYDDHIRELAKAGADVPEMFDALTVADVQQSADVFRPAYDATKGADGYASLRPAGRDDRLLQERRDQGRRRHLHARQVLHDLSLDAGDLELDVHQQPVAGHAQDLLERRNALAAERRPASHASIRPPDLLEGQRGDLALSVGRAGQGRVVNDHEVTVGGDAHVEFDSIGTLLAREAERRKGILGGVRVRPAMRDDQRRPLAQPGVRLHRYRGT